MKCPHCGQLYVDNAKFCPSCGAPNEYFGREVPPEQQERPIYSEKESYREEQYDYGAPRNAQPVYQETNYYGIASVVFGIIGLIVGGLICGIVSLVMAGASKRQVGPNGLATAGKILGIIAIVKIVFAVILVVIMMVMYGDTIMEMAGITGIEGLFVLF